MRVSPPAIENGWTRALVLCVSLIGVPGLAADVPAVLPRPDQTPPSDGKVKVYILAGQSNMVGFGYLQGARPVPYKNSAGVDGRWSNSRSVRASNSALAPRDAALA